MVENKKLLAGVQVHLGIRSWVHRIYRAAVGIAVLFTFIILVWTLKDVSWTGLSSLARTHILAIIDKTSLVRSKRPAAMTVIYTNRQKPVIA